MKRSLYIPILAVLTLAASASARKVAPPQGRPVPGGFGEPGAGAPAPPLRNFLPSAMVPMALPHPSKAAVLELLDDDAGRFSRILNEDPNELGKGGAWGEDCFSGACSIKIAGYQRFRSNIAGWNFPVVEKPKPGEYRYLRFAWKKPEGAGVMVQLCLSSGEWGRYFAGQNSVGFHPALSVAPQPPREWEVVTRDLYTDFGGVPFNLTGFALVSMDGVALFDHVYLGRTIEDLDRVTEAARTWSRKTGTLGTAQLEEHWKNLSSEDAAIRKPSEWTLGGCGVSSVPFVTSQLKVPDTDAVDRAIRKAIADLDAPRYAVRERALKDLENFGRTALADLEAALKEGISPEWRMRLEKLIAKCKSEETLLTPQQQMTLRSMRVLELSEAAEAKSLLESLAKGGLEAGLSLEAKAAVERMEKRRR